MNVEFSPAFLYNQAMNKKGFTLSETLITAVIIGVVATLTIPVIYGNYMWEVRRAKVMNFSKIMNNAIDDALVENEEKHFIGDDGCFNDEIVSIMNHLRPYLPITEECGFETDGKCSFNDKYKYFSSKLSGGFLRNTDLWYKFNLNDGSHVYFFSGRYPYAQQYTGTYVKSTCEIEYDMNGDKGPNRSGYDLFSFELNDRQKMVPQGTSYNTNGEYLKYCENDAIGEGSSCTAKIMNNIKY